MRLLDREHLTKVEGWCIMTAHKTVPMSAQRATKDENASSEGTRNARIWRLISDD